MLEKQVSDLIIFIIVSKGSVAANENKVPNMTHQVAIIEEDKEEENFNSDNIRVIKESENYFDKIMAVESKDLKFFFDPRKQSDDAEYHDDWMYCYFLEVCPHQQDLEQLR